MATLNEGDGLVKLLVYYRNKDKTRKNKTKTKQKQNKNKVIVTFYR